MGDQKLGKIAYDAYKNSSNGKSLISGAQLPEFDDQKFEIREAWQAAAVAVVEHIGAR